jgi:polyisoprenoid-binding protein YceI
MMSAQTTNSQIGSTNAVAVATSSRGASIRYEVPFLEDTDGYVHWHFCVTMVLEESDLMGVVDGTLAMPNATTDPAGHADWMSKDRRARIQIATTLRKSALNLILRAKTAKECWDKLEA